MLIIPAIDIRNGKCVRLYQGKDDQQTVYSKDPVEMASIWYQRGAKMLHIADLDGAFQGHPANLDYVARMKKNLPIPIQVGGGFRDLQSIQAALDAGVDRVILGTAAVYNPELVNEAVSRFGPAVAVSIDVSDDFVAVAGWKEISAVRFDTLAGRMRDLGIQQLLFTDTRKDGTLTGPNIDGVRLFLAASQGVQTMVSGGVTTLEDIAALKAFALQGVNGIIVGKALYDRRITLESAMNIAG